MLPASIASPFISLRMWAMSAVVVVFPLVPVTAMMLEDWRKWSAISTSLATRTPLARAISSGAELGGTPGLTTTSADRPTRSRSCPPACAAIPSAPSALTQVSNASDREASDA